VIAYWDSARADTFPNTFSKPGGGTPVVATAVGGIPEQIQPANMDAVFSNALTTGHATGVFCRRRRRRGADVAGPLMNSEPTPARRECGARCAAIRLNQQVESYLAWYRTII
jgi:hypothetical protein